VPAAPGWPSVALGYARLKSVWEGSYSVKVTLNAALINLRLPV
jgi:hypothetical protein